MTKAVVVGDSLSPQGDRLTSLLCTFPKYLLAEAKTHRIVSQDSNQVEIQKLDVSFNADKNLSRNSASSRAIPTHRLLEQVKNNPFIPMAWQKEHTGMQGKEYFTGLAIDNFPQIQGSPWNKMSVKDYLNAIWLDGRNDMVHQVELLHRLGATKQMANRLLEPFLWTTVLVSATEWENFFELRCPQYTIGTYNMYDELEKTEVFRSKKDLIGTGDRGHVYIHENDTPNRFKRGAWTDDFNDLDWLQLNKGQAEIHMMQLAECIWDAMNESKPRQLQAGEWHIPFEDKIMINSQELLELSRYRDLMYKDEWWANGNFDTAHKVKIATAMAARTSYTVVGDEKEISYERLIGIHDRLIKQVPLHASPMEHCAKVMDQSEWESYHKGSVEWDGDKFILSDNASGWCRNFRGFIQYRHIIEEKHKNNSI